MNQTVERVEYVDRPVIQYVDKPVIQYAEKPVARVPVAKVIPAPEKAPKQPDEDWNWIHRVRAQLSKSPGWTGHNYLQQAFEPLKPVTFDRTRVTRPPATIRPLRKPEAAMPIPEVRPQREPGVQAPKQAAGPRPAPASIPAPRVAPTQVKTVKNGQYYW